MRLQACAGNEYDVFQGVLLNGRKLAKSLHKLLFNSTRLYPAMYIIFLLVDNLNFLETL